MLVGPVITGAAHVPNMEQPAQLDRLLLDFLAAHIHARQSTA